MHFLLCETNGLTKPTTAANTNLINLSIIVIHLFGLFNKLKYHCNSRLWIKYSEIFSVSLLYQLQNNNLTNSYILPFNASPFILFVKPSDLFLKQHLYGVKLLLPLNWKIYFIHIQITFSTIIK